MKKALWLFLGALVIHGYSFSQSETAIKYAGTITQSELRKDLEIIASPAMEGRATGTRGLNKAAAYISEAFRKMGLDSLVSLNGYYQRYNVLQDTVMPKVFKIGNEKYTFGVDYLITRGTKNQNEFKSKEIVFAGYGIKDRLYSDYKNKNVKGKVVVIFPGEPKTGDHFLSSSSNTPSQWGSGISEKIGEAKEQGAKAILLVNPSPDILLTNAASNPDLPDQIPEKNYLPVVTITLDVFTKIFASPVTEEIFNAEKNHERLDRFQLKEKAKIKLVYGREQVLSVANNVIGWIEGTDKKDEYVVISAHYDHLGIEDEKIFYGADDNGSGTSGLLALATAFSKAKEDGKGPSRSVVFIAFSGEEKGLLGSQYYVSHPVFSLDSTSALINIDMIGRVQPQMDTKKSRDYLYVVGDDKRSSDLAGLITSVNGYSKLTLDYKYNDLQDPEMIFYRSDHYSFAQRGVPVVFFTNGTHKDYHRSTDTVDKIDFEVMEKRVQFIFLVAWKMANRDDMLKRDLRIP